MLAIRRVSPPYPSQLAAVSVGAFNLDIFPDSRHDWRSLCLLISPLVIGGSTIATSSEADGQNYADLPERAQAPRFPPAHAVDLLA